MNQSPRTVIVSDGGLASLVACAVAKETAALDGRSTAGISVLPMPGLENVSSSLRAIQEKAARIQAEVFGFELWDPLSPSAHGPLGSIQLREQETLCLLAAAQLAARKECDVVVWPVQCCGPLGNREDEGLDLNWIARAADKSVLVSRLVAVDADAHRKPGIRIDTPYLDVTDHQLADLAAEMELPMRACWWWSISRREGDLAVAERERWLRALAFVGWTAPVT